MNLAHLAEVEAFEQIQGGLGEAALVAHYLAQPGALGPLRAAQVLTRSLAPPPGALRVALTEAALRARAPAERALLAALIVLEQVQESTFAGFDALEHPAGPLPLLERHLGELAALEARAPLDLEAEAYLHYAATLCCQAAERHALGGVHAARLQHLAYLLETPYLRRVALFMRATLLAVEGRFSESLGLQRRIAEDPAHPPASRQHAALHAAIDLFNLGDMQAARRLLCGAQGQPHSPEAAAYLAWGAALYGPGEAGPAPEAHHNPDQRAVWVAQLTRDLLEGQQLLRHERERRSVLTQQVLGRVAQARFQMWYTDAQFCAWVLGKAYQDAHNPGRAHQEVLRAEALAPDEHLNRALLAALRLELFLTPGAAPVGDPGRLEGELRAVFDAARRFSVSAAQGLAALVGRWHPRAAGYLACMPDAVPELRPALEAVLHLDERHLAHGVVVPPAVAVEQTLWDFGLTRHLKSAPLNKAMLRQREALRDPLEPSRWRPVVSPALLAWGLYKAAEALGEAHRHAAEALVRQHGLLPQSRAPYGAGQLAFLEAQLSHLRQGHLTAKGLAHAVLEY